MVGGNCDYKATSVAIAIASLTELGNTSIPCYLQTHPPGKADGWVEEGGGGLLPVPVVACLLLLLPGPHDHPVITDGNRPLLMS